ncbi:hypothetical protein AYO39_00510 [Actinobacteria bacterium SCGC AG-212-D09]|nr:hypothetical protein AYO39_00510 [Actinobacteria bacterium SCGC AG-212-D09]
MLREFMTANAAKPEEQATAVLAASLRTSECFRQALLGPLQLEEQGSVVIDTEVGTGAGQEAVDIELRITGDDGHLRRRVWIEVKVNSRLAGARGGKDPQLKRYRKALDVLDQKRSDLQPSVLAVLLLRADEKQERPQIDATHATVLHWQDVADIAEACGRARSGVPNTTEWRQFAQRPEATLELANLDTLLWFVDAGKRKNREGELEDIVGIRASSPVTDRHAADYGSAYEAVMAIALLAERAATELDDRGSVTEWVETESGVDDEGIFDALMVVYKAEPRGIEGWWHADDGSMEFWLMPFDPEAAAESVPQLWTGITFHQPVPIAAGWRGELEKAGFLLDEDDDGLLESVGVQEALISVIGPADSLREQAKRAATWIDKRLTELRDVSPP